MQAAFGVALQQALDVGMVQTEQRLACLAGLVRSGLAQVPGVTVRDRGRRLCAICSFTKVEFLLAAVTGPSLGASSPSSSHAPHIPWWMVQSASSFGAMSVV